MSNQLHDALDEVVGSGWHSLGSDTEIMVALIDQLRAERAELAALKKAVLALSEYLPIQHYLGSKDTVPEFFTCAACSEQGETARSVAHYAECPWVVLRALVATQEGGDATSHLGRALAALDGAEGLGASNLNEVRRGTYIGAGDPADLGVSPDTSVVIISPAKPAAGGVE